MSLGLGQTASLEPVVEAAIDVGVRALAGTAANSARLPMKPPGYSVFPIRPGVFFTSSRMFMDFLFKLLHECCRCELTLDEDSRTIFETG